MKSISLILGSWLMLTTTCQAQCDRKLYDDLRHAHPPFDVLKQYSIQSRKIEGVPFSTQYSYVFTKGKTYGFLVKQSGKPAQALSLTLTNNDGGVLNADLVPFKTEKDEMMTYTAPSTGIYYMTVHATPSFDGCAVLQLSFTEDNEKFSKAKERSFVQVFRDISSPTKSVMLREFEAAPGKKTEYSYVLTSKKTYGLIVRKENPAAEISFSVRSGSEVLVPEKPVVNKDGLLEVIRPNETGVYFFEFSNADKQAIAMARLVELKEISQ